MKIGSLSLLSLRSGRGALNLASWHSRHSLTWSWILTLTWALPGYARPNFQWSAIGPQLFRQASVGSLVNVYAMRDNNGWQWGMILLGLGLRWSRQHPMWYRDLWQSEQNRRYERRVA